MVLISGINGSGLYAAYSVSAEKDDTGNVITATYMKDALFDFTDSDEISGYNGSAFATPAELSAGINTKIENNIIDVKNISCSATGSGNIALGTSSIAGGKNSFVYGLGGKGVAQNIASGDHSIILGWHSKAIGRYSTVLGGNYCLASADVDPNYEPPYSGGPVAQGLGTSSLGHYTHTEGIGTIASNQASHAEGGATSSFGVVAHAEGSHTLASGEGSHTEGSGTSAYGICSHAEGQRTIAGSDYMHVAGTYNETTADALYVIGNGTADDARSDAFIVYPDGSVSAQGKISANGVELGATPPELSAGTDLIIQNNIISVNTDGTANSAYMAFVEGSSTLASGECSHAEGSATSAIGSASYAGGCKTLASGDYSHAEGKDTSATNYYTHAEGCSTKAAGVESHAEGWGTFASGHNSHAEGNYTTAVGSNSHAEGYQTLADYCAHSEGDSTSAIGNHSHAEGQKTIATKNCAHAEGQQTSALYLQAHAEGGWTLADNNGAHAEGYYTEAIGFASHTEGYETSAAGMAAHAEGYYTSALVDFSHAEGYYTIANEEYMHAGGKFNKTSANAAFVIGNGTSNTSRSDAFIVDWSGCASAVTLATSGISDVESAINEISAGLVDADDFVKTSAINCTIGFENSALSGDTLAQGSNNTAVSSSFAQGTTNYADSYSIAQGNSNTASNYSQALGKENSATNRSFIAGINNSANSGAFVLGSYNNASGAILLGSYLTGKSFEMEDTSYGESFAIDYDVYPVIVGRSNKTSSDAYFVVGNGDDPDAEIRSDAFIVSSNNIASAADFLAGNGVSLSSLTGINIDSYVKYNDIQYAIGSANTATGSTTSRYSVALGTRNSAYNSFVIGNYNKGKESHIFGDSNSGINSYIVGYNCTGNESYLFGKDLSGKSWGIELGDFGDTCYPVIVGNKNATNTSAYFVVGCGNTLGNADAFIVSSNKIASAADFIAGNGVSLSSLTGLSQVQADWDETVTSNPAYIQNKPDVLIPVDSPAALGGISKPTNIMVVSALPSSPDSATIYLVQGTMIGN